MEWKILYYNEKIKKEILNFPAGLLARYLKLTECMEMFGPDLRMPHSRAMGNGLFELRIKAKEGIARTLYCTLVGQRILILHSFIKKTEKTPPKELAIAKLRMKEVKNDNS